MEKELLIEVKNMTKFFGPTQALKGVDMRFYRGEIRGLIGENGSGKSTVTSIIAGMQAASGGTMTYKGKAGNLKIWWRLRKPESAWYFRKQTRFQIVQWQRICWLEDLMNFQSLDSSA